jgi:hypothetical protein
MPVGNLVAESSNTLAKGTKGLAVRTLIVGTPDPEIGPSSNSVKRASRIEVRRSRLEIAAAVSIARDNGLEYKAASLGPEASSTARASA